MYSLFVSRVLGAGFGTFWNDEIREKVSRNVKIDRLTSPEIVDYIKKNKLYQLK